MTALVSFAQDFQDFHLVRGDRFAPFKHQIPRLLAGLFINYVIARSNWTQGTLVIYQLL